MSISGKKGFHYLLIISSLVFSYFSPTLQSLISNRGEWPGLGMYPIAEFLNPEYWYQMLAFVLYAVGFYIITLAVISCGYHTSKIANFIFGWMAGTSMFFMISLILNYPDIYLDGDALYRAITMGFVTLMFGEMILKRLQGRRVNPEDILPKFYIWLCESISVLGND